MLYPESSSTRTVIDLSGMWEANFDFANEGLKKQWHKKVPAGRTIAVPASWNDQFTELKIRDFMGPVWYSRELYVPADWNNKVVHLHFCSATHRAKVWLNGTFLGEHEGGYTPFSFMVNRVARFGQKNKLVVYVDYILDAATVPQGNLPRGIGGYAGWHETNVPSVPFDFFPYGGIHRPVYLYATEESYVDDVTVKTDIKGKTGIVKYEILTNGKKGATLQVTVGGIKQNHTIIKNKVTGAISIPNCRLWSNTSPNLYDLNILVKNAGGAVLDDYTLQIGVRTVVIKGNHCLLNGKPVYFKGFGRHEDFFIYGKGLTPPVMVRDYEIMKWTNANSFRTSHYPYAVEQIRMADQQGFMVVLEAPAVTTSLRSIAKLGVYDKALANHLQMLREMYHTYKNHPSVVMYSLADESEKGEPDCLRYFTALTKEMRRLDDTRPISMAATLRPNDDKISQLFDLVIFNIYACWYGGTGLIEQQLEPRLVESVDGYYKKFKKPVLIGEFGADSFSDMHALPSEAFTQEYHAELLEKTIAWYRTRPYIIGEHVWVLNDFKVAQSNGRQIVNRKGMFTRDRQPKMVAHTLKKIWDPKNDKY